MSFVETRFPTDISYGSSGGPEYATDIVTTLSGHEKRNVNWLASRARYNVAHGVKTQTQLDALIAFFRARKGRAYGFRFKDWADYRGVNEWLGEGDGATNQLQIVKQYSDGGVSELRQIKKPVVDSVQLYVDGVALSGGVSVDTATGMVTLDAAPSSGAIITADFEFDVPVRFDTDPLIEIRT